MTSLPVPDSPCSKMADSVLAAWAALDSSDFISVLFAIGIEIEGALSRLCCTSWRTLACRYPWFSLLISISAAMAKTTSPWALKMGETDVRRVSFSP